MTIASHARIATNVRIVLIANLAICVITSLYANFAKSVMNAKNVTNVIIVTSARIAQNPI